MTVEATTFAAQFWDPKTHPTKASQQEFLATFIHIDVEKNVAGFWQHTRPYRKKAMLTVTVIPNENG